MNTKKKKKKECTKARSFQTRIVFIERYFEWFDRVRLEFRYRVWRVDKRRHYDKSRYDNIARRPLQNLRKNNKQKPLFLIEMYAYKFYGVCRLEKTFPLFSRVSNCTADPCKRVKNNGRSVSPFRVLTQ